jgi:hypothetical protein
LNQNRALAFCFDAFSSREPVPTSLENALVSVAGAILLRIFQPLEAVPLMMAYSIGVQAANLWALRRNIQ